MDPTPPPTTCPCSRLPRRPAPPAAGTAATASGTGSCAPGATRSTMPSCSSSCCRRPIPPPPHSPSPRPCWIRSVPPAGFSPRHGPAPRHRRTRRGRRLRHQDRRGPRHPPRSGRTAEAAQSGTPQLRQGGRILPHAHRTPPDRGISCVVPRYRQPADPQRMPSDRHNQPCAGLSQRDLPPCPGAAFHGRTSLAQSPVGLTSSRPIPTSR